MGICLFQFLMPDRPLISSVEYANEYVIQGNKLGAGWGMVVESYKIVY